MAHPSGQPKATSPRYNVWALKSEDAENTPSKAVGTNLFGLKQGRLCAFSGVYTVANRLGYLERKTVEAERLAIQAEQRAEELRMIREQNAMERQERERIKKENQAALEKQRQALRDEQRRLREGLMKSKKRDFTEKRANYKMTKEEQKANSSEIQDFRIHTVENNLKIRNSIRNRELESLRRRRLQNEILTNELKARQMHIAEQHAASISDFENEQHLWASEMEDALTRLQDVRRKQAASYHLLESELRATAVPHFVPPRVGSWRDKAPGSASSEPRSARTARPRTTHNIKKPHSARAAVGAGHEAVRCNRGKFGRPLRQAHESPKHYAEVLTPRSMNSSVGSIGQGRPFAGDDAMSSRSSLDVSGDVDRRPSSAWSSSSQRRGPSPGLFALSQGLASTSIPGTSIPYHPAMLPVDSSFAEGGGRNTSGHFFRHSVVNNGDVVGSELGSPRPGSDGGSGSERSPAGRSTFSTSANPATVPSRAPLTISVPNSPQTSAQNSPVAPTKNTPKSSPVAPPQT
eukprot:Rmarinus@m.30046